MNAGRELDALVAEKVMGCKWGEFHNTPDEPGRWEDHKFLVDPDGNKVAVRWKTKNLLTWDMCHYWPSRPLRPYSTDIAAAWEVVEKFISEGVSIYRDDRQPSKGKWYALFGDGCGVEADTVPLAICLAALKAVGVEVS